MYLRQVGTTYSTNIPYPIYKSMYGESPEGIIIGIAILTKVSTYPHV